MFTEIRFFMLLWSNFQPWNFVSCTSHSLTFTHILWVVNMSSCSFFFRLQFSLPIFIFWQWLYTFRKLFSSSTTVYMLFLRKLKVLLVFLGKSSMESTENTSFDSYFSVDPSRSLQAVQVPGMICALNIEEIAFGITEQYLFDRLKKAYFITNTPHSTSDS